MQKPLKEGDRGWKQAQREGEEDRMTLGITLLSGVCFFDFGTTNTKLGASKGQRQTFSAHKVHIIIVE